jgi:hypothetical protein
MTPTKPLRTDGEQFVKGALILGSLWAYADITSPVDKEQLVLELPDDLRTALVEGSLLSVNWYPAEWHKALLRRATFQQGPRIAREMARRVVRRDLNGVYRLFLRAIGTRRAFELVARLWPTYTRIGTMVTSVASPRVLTVRWAGCVDFDHVYWEGAFGGVIGSLEAMGATSVKIDVTSGGGRSPDCEVRVIHY